jgi:hypothetical protein
MFLLKFFKEFKVWFWVYESGNLNETPRSIISGKAYNKSKPDSGGN